jgi:Ca-activated chloride channel homolog
MRYSFGRSQVGAGLALIVLVVAACGGGAATPTPAAPTEVPGQTPDQATAPAATDPSTGEPGLDAAAEVPAGTEFEVAWTGPNALGDYVTIVKKGATAWTNEDYVNTTDGSPQKLTAPSIDGAYELWYVSGESKAILARRPITVLKFAGSLSAPDSVEANHEFDVAWVGPNGPGDYVTIVKQGATQWTNEDYFNATDANPSKLLAPVQPGAYEIWYVIGSDRTIQVRRTITVTPTSATLAAPTDIAKGTQFQVAWTGPNGPSDYVTIVPAGSPPSTYLSYFNTNSGSPGTLTAPTDGGNYEIWYVAGQDSTVLASAPIKVH